MIAYLASSSSLSQKKKKKNHLVLYFNLLKTQFAFQKAKIFNVEESILLSYVLGKVVHNFETNPVKLSIQAIKLQEKKIK